MVRFCTRLIILLAVRRSSRLVLASMSLLHTATMAVAMTDTDGTTIVATRVIQFTAHRLAAGFAPTVTRR